MEKTVHQQKQCQVIIKKPKVKIFNWYAMVMGAMRIAKVQKRAQPFTMQTMTEYLYNETYNKYSKYITSDLSQFKKVRDSFDTKHKVLYDPNPQNVTFDKIVGDYYYVISDNGFQTDQFEDKTSYTNGRVLSVQTDQKVEGLWTANIELDNTDEYFLLKDTAFDSSIDFAENECIIEANDEVIIYTTNNQGDFKKIFTGYVGVVSVNDDGVNKRINLSCSDITKKLVMDRVMIEPSLTPWTNEGFNITPFANILIPQPPAELIAKLLYLTYCEYYKDDSFVEAMNKALEAANNVQGAINITQLANSLKTVQRIILELFPKYVSIEYEFDSNGNPVVDVNANGVVSQRIVGFTGYKQPDSEIDRDLIFSINNLNQPVWQWQFNSGNYNIYTSEYKTHNEVISTIAKSVFYEFYADVNGVIRFAPTNLSFPSYISNDESIEFIEGMGKFPDIYNAVMRNYILLREDEVYVTSMQENNNDTNIYTDINVTGQFQTVPGAFPWLRSENVASWDLRAKYGIRMAGTETRTGYQTPESVESYGRARLLRLNADHWNANIQMHGNSDIFPGMPMFIERWLALYYITSVTHSFVVGQSYSMSINLAHKRTPIAMEYDTTSTPLNYFYTQKWLKNKLDNNMIYREFYDVVWDNRAFLTWGKLKHPSGKIYWLVWNYIPTDFKPVITYEPCLIQKQDIVKNSISQNTAVDLYGNKDTSIQSVMDAFTKANNHPSVPANKKKLAIKTASMALGEFIPAQQINMASFKIGGRNE